MPKLFKTLPDVQDSIRIPIPFTFTSPCLKDQNVGSEKKQGQHSVDQIICGGDLANGNKHQYFTEASKNLIRWHDK